MVETSVAEEPLAKPDQGSTDPGVTDLAPAAPPTALPNSDETPATTDPTNPESAKPESAKPESLKPESAKPESAKPEFTKPESAKSDGENAGEPEAVGDNEPTTPSQGSAALLIEAEAGTLFQLDHRPWQLSGAAPIAVVPGAHHVSTIAGQHDFIAVAQKTVTLHLDTSRAEHLSHAAQESSHHADYRKAQRQLEQALSICSQDRKNAAACAVLAIDMTFRLGQVRAKQNEWPEAMTEYQKVTAMLRKVKVRPELKAQVEKVMKELRGYVCKVVVRARVGTRCVEDTVWVGPGSRTVKVGERQELIEAQAGAELQLGTCK
jgi:hypothetical protein